MTSFRDVERIRHDVGELLAEHERGRPLEDFARWADDPVGFVRHYGGEPTDYQCRILESARDHRFSAVRGCHGAGKEWTAGWLAVWGAYARRMLVLVISASERQVLGQTMREVRSAWRKAVDLPGLLYTGSVRIEGEDRIVALTGGSAVDALTGWHDPHGVMVIISEGQGERLEDTAYDAAIAVATDSLSRVVAMGNPVRPAGRFYEINHRPHWHAIRISAFDTPNVRAGRTVAPGFPAAEWPVEVEREYGKDSPFYISRVLAEFPSSSIDSLVERPWIDAAIERWRRGWNVAAEGTTTLLTLDVARFGADECVMGESRGKHMHEFQTWRGKSLTETAALVRSRATTIANHSELVLDGGHLRPTPRRVRVIVDEAGVGGGVVDGLRGDGVSVTGFIGAATPNDPRRFANLRAEAHWMVREALRLGTWAIPDDPKLVEELLAVTWAPNSQDRIQIEPKDEIRAKIGRSPDRLDVLTMAVWAEANRREVRFFEWRVA